MTKQEIKEKMRQFLGYVLQEKELQERVLKLKLHSKDKDVLKERIREQDTILEEIDALRKNKILPIIDEVAKFISSRKKELQEGKIELTEEEYYRNMFDATMDLANDDSFKDFLDNLTPESEEE